MNLGLMLDQLPPPTFPDNFSEEEQTMVLLALASAKQQIRPFDGEFEAPWLLTPFSSDVWETTNRGREELIDGVWRNTIRIDWRIVLPNGRLLTDSRYELLLTLTKKIAYFSRCDLIAGTSAPIAWRTTVSVLVRFIRWVVLHDYKFMPEKFGLQLLDQATIEWFLGLIAQGGWTHALQIPQRILSVAYMGTNGVPCPQPLLDNPYQLASTEIAAMVPWFERQAVYKTIQHGTHFGKRCIDRGVLSILINANVDSLKSKSASRFLRQFETDFGNETLFVSVMQYTEFPLQDTPSMQDFSQCISSEGTVVHTASLVASMLDAHRHIPELLPDPINFSLRRAVTFAKRETRTSSHTLLMPIETGLQYLQTAIRFVHLYGDGIISLYLAVITDERQFSRSYRLNKIIKQYLTDFPIESGEPIATVLNITECWRSEVKQDFNRLRSNPTLVEALRVLIGSCIVCMSMLKPSRLEELTHLKRDCLRQYDDGYWINYSVGKSNSNDAWQDTDRPIPFIAGKAIHLLQRLGENLSAHFAEDRKIGDNLFYLPNQEGTGALSATAQLLCMHLDIFSDFTGLPPDERGCRWYVRIHEMRKWFLLLLFWSGKFDVLDAARWIAGHTNAEHVYAYITSGLPGEELPELESEFAIDRIYRHEQDRKRGHGEVNNKDDIDALYKVVLAHFNVDSLTTVPTTEWNDYVQSLRKNEKFHLEPHSIFAENGRDIIGLNVSFVLRGTIQ